MIKVIQLYTDRNNCCEKSITCG